MEHDINLNIHYTIPENLWEQVVEVFHSMPYWSGNKCNADVMWNGDDI